jgi:hypothetical protein
MALLLNVCPDMVGLRAFLDACKIPLRNLNPKTKYYDTTAGGLKLRLTEDKEYIVEADLYPAKATSQAVDHRNVSYKTFRTRNAFRSARVESEFGRTCLITYRKLLNNDEAELFLAKSRMSGGKTPLPLIAIIAIPYFIREIGTAALGLDRFPNFMTLVNRIEPLPECPLTTPLRIPQVKHATAQELIDEVASSEDDTGFNPNSQNCWEKREAKMTTTFYKQRQRDVKAEQLKSKIALSGIAKELQAEKIKCELSQIKAREFELKANGLETEVRVLRDTTTQLGVAVEQRVIMANPSLCGAYAESACGPHIASAFIDFGKTSQTAGVESHCADFIQLDSPWFIVLHELKYGQNTIVSSTGIDKLINDINFTEEKYQRPVLIATLTSWRSNIATMAEDPISFKMAENGHTLIICVNNVERLSLAGGGNEAMLRIACQIAKQYVEQISKSFINILSFGIQDSDDLPEIIKCYFNTEIGTEANKFLVSLASKVLDETLPIGNFTTMAIEAKGRGRSSLRTVTGIRSTSRHWDGPRAVSARRTVVIDDCRFTESAIAVVNEEGIRAAVVDECGGIAVQAEIDRDSGDASATVTTKEVVGQFTRDGITGAMVCKAIDQRSGNIIEQVYHNEQLISCVGGIELPRDIPEEWHAIFDVKKAWGATAKQVADVLMSVSKTNPQSTVGRFDVKKRLLAVQPNLSDKTLYRHLDFILNSSLYTTGTGGKIKGIELL